MVDNGHLVLRERAGFVGADYLRTSERLDRGELAYNRIFLRHICDAYREHYSNNGGEPLGNGGNSEAHCDHEHINYALEYQRRVSARESRTLHKQRKSEYENTDAEHKKCQRFGELRELLLQRGLPVLSFCYRVGYFAHLSVHARVGDDRFAAPVDDGAAHISHIFSVAERNIAAAACAEGGYYLAHGHALAGQRGFFDFEARAFKYAAVRGNGVARFKHHNIADGQILALDGCYPALANDLRGRRTHLLQRFNGFFRFALLQNAEHRVYEHDCKNYHRVRRERRRARNSALVYRGDGGYYGGDDKNDYHRVGKLFEEPPDK